MSGEVAKEESSQARQVIRQMLGELEEVAKLLKR
jgi:hypothetical protein